MPWGTAMAGPPRAIRCHHTTIAAKARFRRAAMPAMRHAASADQAIVIGCALVRAPLAGEDFRP